MIDNIFSSRILYSLSLQKISQENLCPVIRPDNFIVVLQYKKGQEITDARAKINKKYTNT